MISGRLTCDVCNKSTFDGNNNPATIRQQAREAGWRQAKILADSTRVDVCNSCEIPKNFREVIGVLDPNRKRLKRFIK